MTQPSRKTATPGDGISLQSLPPGYVTLPLDIVLSPSQAASVNQGFIPGEQHEPHFCYFIDNTLIHHDRVTGYCLDHIHFTGYHAGLRATHAHVNRDPEQNPASDDLNDVRRITDLLHYLANLDLPPLAQVQTNNNLGDPNVVRQLMTGWFGNCALQLNGRTTPLERNAALEFLVRVMSEDDTGYFRRAGWHDRAGLGRALEKRFVMDEQQCAGEELAVVVRLALEAVEEEIQVVCAQLLVWQRDAAGWEKKMRAMLEEVVEVFVGGRRRGVRPWGGVVQGGGVGWEVRV